MADILTWLEGSALGHFMRESSFWTYPVVNLLHLVGIATFFGSILLVDLRLLGVWSTIPVANLTTPGRRVAQVGFILAATTGVALLATQATEYIGNLYLLIKFPAIGLGLLNVAVVSRSAAWRAIGQRALTPAEDRRLAVMGGVSLACWLTAITAGRMIAYW